MLAGEKEGLCWLRKAHHAHRVLNPLKSPSSRGSAARGRTSHAATILLPSPLPELSWAGLGAGVERDGVGGQGPGAVPPRSCHGNHDRPSASQKH